MGDFAGATIPNKDASFTVFLTVRSTVSDVFFTAKDNGFTVRKVSSKLVMSDRLDKMPGWLLFALFGLVFFLLGDRVELLGTWCSRGEDSAADVSLEAIGFSDGLAGG